MTTPFKAFSLYNAVKLHFTSDYDAYKYNFKTNVTEKSFWKRKDKYFFAKLGKRFNEKDLLNFYISNFIVDNRWVGDMLNHDDDYISFQKYIESLHYNLTNEFEKLSQRYDNFNDLFDIKDGPYPTIIQEYLSGNVTIHLLTALDILIDFIKPADKKIGETILWPDIRDKINNYKPFLRPLVDKNKLRNNIISIYESV